jgi:pyruvate dehydrogenase (quinone)
VGLVGDARETLRELLPLLKRNDDRTFLENARRGMREWWELIQKRATSQDMPMRPQAFAWEVGTQLADDAIVCADSGTNTLYAAREIKIHGTQRWSCSGLLASMGCGLTYAIGAQVAFPDRQVIAFVGDGGLTMVMGEIATCVKYKLPIKIFVVKNNTLGMIRWEQMMFLGNPEYGVELQEIDFAKIAEACGARGQHIERPDELHDAIGQTLAAAGPALLEAVTDPFEPMIPGQIKPEQAEKYAEALKRGQPNAQRIALTLYRDVVEDFESNANTLADAMKSADIKPDRN